MKLSVKWQAVLSLTAILIFVTVVLVAHTLKVHRKAFFIQAESRHQQYQLLFKSQLTRARRELAALAGELESLKSRIDEAVEGQASILDAKAIYEYLDDHRDLGSLATLDLKNPEYWITNRYSLPSSEFEQLEAFRELLDTPGHDSADVASGIFCLDRCFLVSSAPYQAGSGFTSAVVLGRELSFLADDFHKQSSADLSVVSASENPENWSQSRIVLSSRFGSNDAVRSQEYSNFRNAGVLSMEDLWRDTDSQQLLVFEDKKYVQYELNVPDSILNPEAIRIFALSDETELMSYFEGQVQKAIIFIACFVFVSFVLFFVFIGSRVKGLKNALAALKLLPQKKFNEALALVSRSACLVEDEVSLLEKGAAQVVEKLRNLHDEIDTKSLVLQQQLIALKNSQEFLSRLLDNADVYVITQTLDGEILTTNKKASQLGDLVGSKFGSLISGSDDFGLFLEKLEKLVSGRADSFHQEVVLLSERQGSLAVRWTHTLVDSELGDRIILSIGMDYTKQKSAEDNLRWLANHDSLTGLGNRRFFNEMFSELLGSKTECALVFIDVNKFKVINDVYGHGGGDSVLVDIASTLNATLLEPDFAFRLAGDEFTVLLKGDSYRNLEVTLAELNRKLERAITTRDGKRLFYSVSMGAARYPLHGETIEQLMVNADMAMYHVKKKGHGSWRIFDSEDDHAAKLKDETALLKEMRAAIRDRSFSLVYQSIVKVPEGVVSHYEALVRITGIDGVTTEPGEFISLAERYGEIRTIDEWVIDNVLKDLSSKTDMLPDLAVAINVSAPTLQSNDFPVMVFHKIFSHYVEPSRVIIEIPEIAYIENFEQVLRNVTELARHGVKIAVDDFGVGFFSFNYLKQLPLSFVKLDGTCVKGIAGSGENQIFLKSLASMLSAFDTKVIAESVEDETTFDLLQKVGVSFAQGYFISKPQPIDQLGFSSRLSVLGSSVS